MACIPIKTGFICTDDAWLSLAPFGARVWMSYHHYTGPEFYRSESAITPIITPSRKTWDAFTKWRKENAN